MISSSFTINNFETWVPLIALFLVAASWLLHRVMKASHSMTARETLCNVVIFMVWRFVFFVGGMAIQYWIFSKMAEMIPWKIPNGPAAGIAAVLVADFLYYWKHRKEHEINILWAQHSVHHSSEEYNFSTALRLPWVGSYLNWMFFVPALLVGFSAEQILVGHQVVLAYQYLLHTELVRKLGCLELLLATPSHHRVHHGRNEIYLDKNYGGILIVWDRLFGTFKPEVAPVDYGLVHPLNSQNPIVVNFRPWRELYQAVKLAESWTMGGRILFGKPSLIGQILRRNH